MNELRLQYHKETGNYPKKGDVYGSSLNSGETDQEYIEWLEKYIEEATKQAKELLNHNIFYKRK